MFDRLSQGLWWDRAWSLVEGCTWVSQACDHCWSAAMTARFGGFKKGLTGNWPGEPGEQGGRGNHFTGKIICREDRLSLPLKVQKPTAWAVWNDLFHEDVPITFIARAFNTMASVTPGCGKRHRHQEDCWTGDPHIFLVLTKRPNRMFQVLTEVLPNYVGEFFPGDSPLCSALEAGRWPLANVWLGVTVEDQEQADKRIPLLLQAPATLRFLSVEPMLGRIALEQSWWKGSPPYLPWHGAIPNTWLHWVICGGESGPRSKPMHPDWVRNLRDQCQEARVPFFFKQWGEWAPDCFCQTLFPHKNIPRPEPGRMGIMFRCGKKAAGRLLDGRTWDEMPFIENPL